MANGKFYDAYLSQADSGVIQRLDEGQFDTFSEALTSVIDYLMEESIRNYQSDDYNAFRSLIDRLAWFSLGHQDIGAYAPGGGDFKNSEEIMAKRSRVWTQNPKKPYEEQGFIGMVDESGRFQIKEGQGWAYAKDTKAQVAAVLREIALRSDAPPALIFQAVRSLAELAPGTLIDFKPKKWDKDLVGFQNSESNRTFGIAVVEIVPGGPLPVEASAIVVSSYYRYMESLKLALRNAVESWTATLPPVALKDAVETWADNFLLADVQDQDEIYSSGMAP